MFQGRVNVKQNPKICFSYTPQTWARIGNYFEEIKRRAPGTLGVSGGGGGCRGWCPILFNHRPFQRETFCGLLELGGVVPCGSLIPNPWGGSQTLSGRLECQDPRGASKPRPGHRADLRPLQGTGTGRQHMGNDPHKPFRMVSFKGIPSFIHPGSFPK